MCRKLGRCPQGILNKLLELKKLIRKVDQNYASIYYRVGPKIERNSRGYSKEFFLCNLDYSQLKSRVISHNPNSINYLDNLIMTTTTTQPKTIETKTFINGQDASTLSDQQIFDLIEILENEIKRAGAIKNRPEKLAELINQKEADIKALVAYVDGR